MSKINILSSSVFNRIAAGEVVERPSSVVKELVENSIDAGADKIKIAIENGGISRISIIDNGCGIDKTDLKKALLPHATSKISSVGDLDAISTLGFRGEALASIASVSKITIKSKTEEQDCGAEIYSEGGSDGVVDPCESANGTEITVCNLFYNTPVRAKFLKTPKGEENEIYNIVARFILGNPDVSFKFYADDKIVLQSFGDGIESAFISVYGVETLKNCYYIDTEKNGIHISGYIGKPFFTKPNRSYQTVFLNGRYVLNQTISSSVMNAYSSYLMKRQYPFYFLNITMPIDAVDVNVHPNKTDVRFSNNQIVYGSLYSVVSKVLDGTKEAVDIVVKSNNSDNTKIENTDINYNKNDYDYVTHNKIEKAKFVFRDSSDGTEKHEYEFIDPYEKEINKNQSLKNDELKEDIFAQNKEYLEKLEKSEQAGKENNILAEQMRITVEKSLRFIGQALKCYLIFEDDKNIYLIDQHAAHERILFDKLYNAYKQKNIAKQPLLFPYVINVNADEHNFLNEKLSFLNEIGFDLEQFGRNSFRVLSIPAFLTQMDVNLFFKDLFSDLNTLKFINVSDVLFDKLAQKACKSAIKAGDNLSENEIKALTNALNGNLGLKCPHGRPIAVKISDTEIEKWFRRIV